MKSLLGTYFTEVAAAQAGLLLTVVYWTAMALSAVLLRLTRRHLLPDSFGSGASHWITRAPSVRGDKLSRHY